VLLPRTRLWAKLFRGLETSRQLLRTKREHAVDTVVEMLKGLIAAAKKKGRQLAPFVGVGRPGIIEHDGSIERGDPEPSRQLGKQKIQSTGELAFRNSNNWRR
jgi:hypothetical protein